MVPVCVCLCITSQRSSFILSVYDLLSVWCLLIFILYIYFIFVGVMLGMESAGDGVIPAGKRNADVNVAISFFRGKLVCYVCVAMYVCYVCWSCKDGTSLCWVVVALICFVVLSVGSYHLR